MKKLIILASTIVLTASAATVAYVYSQKSSSDLFEANVDALTSGEGTIDVSCAQMSDSTCPVIIKMVDGSSRVINLPHSVKVSVA